MTGLGDRHNPEYAIDITGIRSKIKKAATWSPSFDFMSGVAITHGRRFLCGFVDFRYYCVRLKAKTGGARCRRRKPKKPNGLKISHSLGCKQV